jgi:plastocyanin
MRKSPLYYFLLALVVSLVSCDKSNEGFNPQGGYLPTNYITIKDSSFSPTSLTIVSGNSITFLNSTTGNHQVISSDSVINTGLLAPQGHYFWKKDTFGTFPIHCVQHPSATALITITP